MRSTQLDGRFSLDLALYHVDWKNIQLFEVVNAFDINANGGTATQPRVSSGPSVTSPCRA